MRKKRWIALVMACIMGCLTCIPQGSVQAAVKEEKESVQIKDKAEKSTKTAGSIQKKTENKKKSSKKSALQDAKDITEVLETDVAQASEGCTLYGAYGSYYSQAQSVLDQINTYRKEACEEGDVPDPRDSSRMLTPDDYVPLQWSTDMERIARIRAAEAGYSYHFMESGHDRLTDKGTLSVESNGQNAESEVLSYYYKTDNKDPQMSEGALLWYLEKRAWLNREDISNGATVGHYTNMIDPSYTHIGLGCFYNEATPYPVVLAGELTKETNQDHTMLEEKHNVMQKIEVSNAFLKETYLDIEDSLKTGKTEYVPARAAIQNKDGKFVQNVRQMYLLDIDEYSSSDPSVADITNDGMLTTYKKGTVTITARSNGKDIASKKLTVECGHHKELKSYKEPTCVQEGQKEYYCAVCDDTEIVTVKQKEHDYVYGEADANGVCTGVCSNCNDTITIKPPTSCKIRWENSNSRYYDFKEMFPRNCKAGDTIICMTSDMNGDSAYQDMVIESSDENVIAVKDAIVANGMSYALEIMGDGITQISVYPQYNKRIGKNYIIRIGKKADLSIEDADLVLENDSMMYQNAYCTPNAEVYYDGLKLEKDVDYTLHYENNLAAGTAYAVAEGKGIFEGTLKKAFTIRPSVTQEHTHQAVTDAAIEAGCTTIGYTSGSHCSVCGEVIEAQQVIPAVRHHYVNGVCTYCHDVQYVEEDSIRYQLTEELDGTKAVQAMAADQAVLSGDVTIRENVTLGDASYPVTKISDKGFQAQDKMTTITLPKTLQEIGSKAFARCVGLIQMNFYARKAPAVQDDSWEDRGDGTLVLVVPKNGYGYGSIAALANASVDQTLPNSHMMEYHPAKAETCTEDGNRAYYYCTDCEKYFMDEAGNEQTVKDNTILFALGHSWNYFYTIDIPATATTPGQKSIHCTRCGAQKEITIIPAGQSSDNNGSNSNGSDSNTAWDPDTNGSTDHSDASSSSKSGQSTKNNIQIIVKKGTTFTKGGIIYKVISTTKNTVSCTGTAKKTVSSLTIPQKTAYQGKQYRVVQISRYAFMACSKLKTVTIGNAVTDIEEGAFYHCPKLQKAVIGNKVKKIGQFAFAYCPKLKKIQITSTLLKKKNVAKNIFMKCHKKAVIKVPKAKKKEYRKWFKKTGIALR